MLEIKTSKQIREVRKAKIERHQTTLAFYEPDKKEWVSLDKLKEVLENIEIMRSSCGCSESGAKEFKKELLRRLRDATKRKAKRD